MTATEVATQLQAKKNGAGWLAKCPAHDDNRASLSIGEGRDGRVLVRCHAGCDVDTVTQRPA
jgi:putative DNA primase/helicase